jgi:imidazolonepropionase-like amidohydrolase
MTALRIAKEFNINITLDHCTEGYLMADILRDAGFPVILGPLLTDRSKPELSQLSYEAPLFMYEAGVPFALMTDHPVIPTYLLPLTAALTTRYGLPDRQALEAITIRAAEFNGIADRVGSLSAGKDADIALFDGDPLLIKTRVHTVFIEGRRVFDLKA